MDVHPSMKLEIAHIRNEERLLRGLALYEALRARDDLSAEPAAQGFRGRIRILDRLRRRDLAVTGTPARPTV